MPRAQGHAYRRVQRAKEIKKGLLEGMSGWLDVTQLLGPLPPHLHLAVNTEINQRRWHELTSLRVWGFRLES